MEGLRDQEERVFHALKSPSFVFGTFSQFPRPPQIRELPEPLVGWKAANEMGHRGPNNKDFISGRGFRAISRKLVTNLLLFPIEVPFFS